VPRSGYCSFSQYYSHNSCRLYYYHHHSFPFPGYFLFFAVVSIIVTTVIRGALQSLLGADYVLHPHRRAHASQPGRKTQVCFLLCTCCLLSTVCCLRSAGLYLLSLLSAIYYLLSAMPALLRAYEPDRTQAVDPMTICLLSAFWCLLLSMLPSQGIQNSHKGCDELTLIAQIAFTLLTTCYSLEA
jgi:hypothetical protein